MAWCRPVIFVIQIIAIALFPMMVSAASKSNFIVENVAYEASEHHSEMQVVQHLHGQEKRDHADQACHPCCSSGPGLCAALITDFIVQRHLPFTPVYAAKILYPLESARIVPRMHPPKHLF